MSHFYRCLAIKNSVIVKLIIFHFEISKEACVIDPRRVINRYIDDKLQISSN